MSRLQFLRPIPGVPDRPPATIYPHSGMCARCLRQRDDLFWHAQDEEFYCADVFRCEARYFIQGERLARNTLGLPSEGRKHG